MTRGRGFTEVDLRDYGQVLDVILGLDDRHKGFDAVVHLGAIPAPGLAPDAATFENNMLSTYNVFQAARRAGIKKIVYASSETVLGLPFDVEPPYIPVDEEYPARPESTYSLVKHLEEQMAIQLTRWDPELSIVGLRFSNVMDPEDYEAFPSFDADATLRKWNLWGYIDGRDGAQAVARALENGKPGFRGLHHRQRGHGHEPLQRQPGGGGVPRRQGDQGPWRARDHAVHRQGQAPAGLRPRAQLAQLPPEPHHPHRGLRSIMQYRTLGNSGAVVSNYALGTMTFGAEATEETSHAILDDYVAAGGNFIDTADVYSAGVSEEIIGRWLAARPDVRDRAVLATKGRFPMGNGPERRRHVPPPPDPALG